MTFHQIPPLNIRMVQYAPHLTLQSRPESSMDSSDLEMVGIWNGQTWNGIGWGMPLIHWSIDPLLGRWYHQFLYSFMMDFRMLFHEKKAICWGYTLYTSSGSPVFTTRLLPTDMGDMKTRVRSNPWHATWSCWFVDSLSWQLSVSSAYSHGKPICHFQCLCIPHTHSMERRIHPAAEPLPGSAAWLMLFMKRHFRSPWFVIKLHQGRQGLPVCSVGVFQVSGFDVALHLIHLGGDPTGIHSAMIHRMIPVDSSSVPTISILILISWLIRFYNLEHFSNGWLRRGFGLVHIIKYH